MKSFRLIGDPHITKKFVMNVPLARRGQREIMLFEQFKKELYEGDEEYVIMVGDLFEKPVCSLQDLYKICSLSLQAAMDQPDRLFIFIAGNHDRSAQQEDWGGFDILHLFDRMIENFVVLTKPAVFGEIALFPWEWDRSALDQLEDVRGEDFSIAVGHWDLVAYDEMHKDHFCPAQELVAMGAKEIYSGHWHVAGDYKVEGVTVHCTGSMQPMTHAEDPDGNLYVTMTLEEYHEVDKATLANKYVRVIAPRGEEVDQLEDCLGFKTVWEVDDASEYKEEVKIEEFKMANVLRKSFDKHEVSDDVRRYIKDRIDVDD